MSERGVDLESTRQVDPVPEDELAVGDVVRVVGALEDELGVVVADPPGARVACADTGLTIRADAGPVEEVLKDVDELLGVDVQRQYHCFRDSPGVVVVQDIDGEVELRQPVPRDDLDRWVRYVEDNRGWIRHRGVADSRGWFG